MTYNTVPGTDAEPCGQWRVCVSAGGHISVLGRLLWAGARLGGKHGSRSVETAQTSGGPLPRTERSSDQRRCLDVCQSGYDSSLSGWLRLLAVCVSERLPVGIM